MFPEISCVILILFTILFSNFVLLLRNARLITFWYIYRYLFKMQDLQYKTQ